ncbi:MAG: bifunctional phosphoserine phosphatase/homoserine phosphotransferase ThrH [Litorilinea sp.]
MAPPILASDLEGVLLPEIWIEVAKRTGIESLRLTTRDIDNYDELMQMRQTTLKANGIGISLLQEVIAEMDALPGALEFLNAARSLLPVVVITDSYYELLQPLLPKLGFVTIFAHNLIIDEDGNLAGYKFRLENGKGRALAAFRELGFRTMAVGDSYNDIPMLTLADSATLFCPPEKVINDYPDLPITRDYAGLLARIQEFCAVEAVTT